MKVLAPVIALIAMSLPSFAADLRTPVKTPTAAPAWTWTGFYVGGHAGAAWLTTDGSTSFVPAGGPNPVGQSLDNTGFVGGLQAGYNWQNGNLILGIETDFSYMSNKADSTVAPLTIGVAPFPGSFATLSSRLDWFGTARVRFGLTSSPQLLWYVTGGVAYGQVENNSFGTAFPAVPPIETFFGSSSDVRLGWTAGGGTEWAISRNWSIKAEYLYYDLGSSTVTALPLSPNPGFFMITKYDVTGHIARLGVNYKF